MSFCLGDSVVKDFLLRDYEGTPSRSDGDSLGIPVRETYVAKLPQVFQLEIFKELNTRISKEHALSGKYEHVTLVCDPHKLDHAVKNVAMRKIGMQTDDKKHLVYYFVCKNSFPEGHLPEDGKWGEHNIDLVSSQILSQSVDDAGLYYQESLPDFVHRMADDFTTTPLEPMEYEAQEMTNPGGLCAKISGCLRSIFGCK